MTTILKFFFWSDSTKGMAKVRLVGISLLVSFSFFSRFYWFGLRDESVMRWRDTQISRFLGFCGKKCTHRGCKILVQCIFCSAQKIKPFLNREHTELFQCDLLRPMIMGLRNFFLKMCIWFTTCKCSYRDYLNCYHNWQDLWKNVAVFLYAK